VQKNLHDHRLIHPSNTRPAAGLIASIRQRHASENAGLVIPSLSSLQQNELPKQKAALRRPTGISNTLSFIKTKSSSSTANGNFKYLVFHKDFSLLIQNGTADPTPTAAAARRTDTINSCCSRFVRECCGLDVQYLASLVTEGTFH
jgi:hypothetical protein